MPAINMGSDVTLAANPDEGNYVLMSPFSGPTGSPFDTDISGNASTGALSTGIGFGATHIIGPTAPQSIKDAGFTDNYVPGVTTPSGTSATTAIYTCIGGGKCSAADNGVAAVTPYDAQPILGFGGGVERDAGAGPAFTGHGEKLVTATGTVADGADIEAGFENRTGVTMSSGQSAFGATTADSPAVT